MIDRRGADRELSAKLHEREDIYCCGSGRPDSVRSSCQRLMRLVDPPVGRLVVYTLRREDIVAGWR
jgi:hypothetical protein